MRKFKILVLTDHLTHNKENSVYDLCNALYEHPQVGQVHLASRSHPANRPFFFNEELSPLAVWIMKGHISYESGLQEFMNTRTFRAPRDYDLIWLRLPRPIPEGFFAFLERQLDPSSIINRPLGIAETGSKAFLLNFPELCPPMHIVRSTEEIIRLKGEYPIVLKPLESYGGRGILRIEEDRIYEGASESTFEQYLPTIDQQLSAGGYLAMKYLKNVDQGDKRIIVANGQIVGAVLRIPPRGAWLCNAAQGGKAQAATADYHEQKIIRRLNEVLLPKGIAMYGIDTLVDDDGRRTLSEINTLSIGGVKQLAQLSRQPLVSRTAKLLMDYVTEHLHRSLPAAS